MGPRRRPYPPPFFLSHPSTSFFIPSTSLPTSTCPLHPIFHPITFPSFNSIQPSCNVKTPSTHSDQSTTPPSHPTLNREIITLALPALGALALDPLLSLIDTAFVGRIGVSALAGVGLSTIVLNVSFSIFNFLSISITPLVAKAIYSSSSPSAASSAISTSLLLALFLGVISQSILIPFAPALCTALGASIEALPHAVAYLRFRAIAAPFALMAFATNGALRGLKDLRTPFLVALIANTLNITLDVILIFFLHWGVAGAAIATSVSQIVSLLLMLTRLLTTRRLIAKDLFQIPSFSKLRPLLTAGALLTIRTLSILITVAYATTTAAVSATGVVGLAAYELTRQLWVFNATILDSLAAAAQALVAGAIAAGKQVRARQLADRTIILSAGFGTMLAIMAVISGVRLPRLFTESTVVAEMASKCIKMAAICAPVNGAVFALDGVLAACADYRYMAGAIAIAAIAACGVLTGVRMYGGDVVAVWAGLNVLMIARAVVLGWRYVGKDSPIGKKDDSRKT